MIYTIKIGAVTKEFSKLDLVYKTYLNTSSSVIDVVENTIEFLKGNSVATQKGKLELLNVSDKTTAKYDVEDLLLVLKHEVQSALQKKKVTETEAQALTELINKNKNLNL